jgi:uncharacterized protein involved in exopolysaccharide biosynthesis
MAVTGISDEVSHHGGHAVQDVRLRREIDLISVWLLVWDHKYIVMATAVACALVATWMALVATPIFRAETTIAEVQDSGAGGLGAIAGQLGGLAGLAGINLGGNGQSRERSAILQSRHLVEEFVKRNNLIPVLFRNSKQPPSLWRAVQLFRKDVLLINEDKLKGTTTISMDWTDPVTAARWANGFVELANELVRVRAIDDASLSIEFLNKQISHTNVLEVQRVMYNLIEAQTKTLMLANVRKDYAFTVVDPAVPPENRISPKRTLMVAGGLLIGTLLGMAVALVYDSLRRKRTKAASSNK